MPKIVDKFLNFLGFELVEDDGATGLDKSTTKKNPAEDRPPRLGNKRQERKEGPCLEVVSRPNSHAVKIAIFKPRSFSDIQEAADSLCHSQSTVVELTEIGIEDAQRALDYLSGVAFAINGKASRLGTGVFLFAPANVAIDGGIELIMEQNSQPQSSTEVLDEEALALLKTLGA